MNREILTTENGHEIHVKHLPPKKWWQSARWVLLKEYVSHNGNVIAPKGFITDGATIFILLRWLFSPTGRYFGAAIVHDYIIVSENDFTKANKEFTSEMGHLNVPTWRRVPMVWAVTFWSKIRKYFKKGAK